MHKQKPAKERVYSVVFCNQSPKNKRGKRIRDIFLRKEANQCIVTHPQGIE